MSSRKNGKAKKSTAQAQPLPQPKPDTEKAITLTIMVGRFVPDALRVCANRYSEGDIHEYVREVILASVESDLNAISWAVKKGVQK